MKGSVYTLCYAVALGVLCATALTAASVMTQPFREANEKAEKMRNVFEALEVPFDPKAPLEELFQIFDDNVAEEVRDGVSLFVYRPGGGEAKAVAVEFIGSGLWGPIKGFLALDPTMTTVLGMAIYHQEETPGLGGEIGTEEFRGRFKGISTSGADGSAGIQIGAAANAEDRNAVDAITGATMTCNKLEDLLTQTLREVMKEGGSDVQ